jgi:hypothetical protein
MRRSRIRWATLAIALAVTAVLAAPVFADSGHGRPGCTTQLDELGFGSRDGFDHVHATNPDVFGSLAELEGYLGVCRTNDATVVEAFSASARAVLVRGVVRVQLRALAQQWKDPDGAGPLPTTWVTVASSASVNTGVNRTLTVTTPAVNEVGSVPAMEHTWSRAVIRALVRYSNGSLRFTVTPTYAIWTGDGPVAPATPPS